MSYTVESFNNEIPFPYRPYTQQQELMNSLYDCIDTSSIGCFESPTGTGKSLSVICASCHWLVKEETKILNEISSQNCSSKNDAVSDIKDKKNIHDDDWLSELITNSSSTKNANTTINQSKNLQISSENYQNFKRMLSSVSIAGKNKVNTKYKYQQEALTVADQSSSEIQIASDEFALPEYDSGDDKQSKDNTKKRNIFPTDSDDDVDNDSRNFDLLNLPQIYYCTRTHTQISQFVSEVKKTVFKDIRCITLSGRKNLCVNSEVNKLKSESNISEKCLEMQKNKGKKIETIIEIDKHKKDSNSKRNKTIVEKCSFRNKTNENNFSDFLLSSIKDIEQMSIAGESLHACPYYSSRKAIKHAQLICMPYNLILNKETRDSMGLSLHGKIIIFDEAHNLIETINQTHSAEVFHNSLEVSFDALNLYLNRYQTVLSGRNLYYVNILISVVKKLKKSLEVKIEKSDKSNVPVVSCNNTEIVNVNEFLFKVELESVNLFKLKKHLTETNLVAKVGGYAESAKRAESLSNVSIHRIGDVSGSGNIGYITALRSVLELLTCFTNSDMDGRVVISKRITTATDSNNNNGSILYIMLNASTHFKDIICSARSVILLGGTMQPFEYVTDTLFPSVPSNKLKLFSCDHVVKSDNIFATISSSGSSGTDMEFTFEKRLSVDLLNDLNSFLVQMSSIIPNGVVVFFSSYAYMESVVSRWRSNRQLQLIEKNKQLFVEWRQSLQEDNVLSAYSNAARSSSGAMLFSVMGGKLSEGINFSDELARCVIVVGLPYPDKRDPILREKLNYADSQFPNTGASEKLYDSVCMKTVNQSIGRSIRHANDYASIILLDSRYKRNKVISQLPGWISKHIRQSSTIEETKKGLIHFFANKRSEYLK